MAMLAMMKSTELLLLAPLVLVWLLLTAFALVDLVRRERVRGSKVAWGLVILLISSLGPIAYLILGREDV
jgi:hypothetical protein